MFTGSLEKALLEFLSSTTVSSAIVEMLARNTRPMRFEDILNEIRNNRQKRIPQNAVESALDLLRESGIVDSAEEGYRLTDVGLLLVKKLKGLHGS
ncbi:hypothetical protein JXM67_14105 [candidate division WOR-3 bacterium]|nr:hypothetical protein [candidate division WOR-3 bacterium]